MACFKVNFTFYLVHMQTLTTGARSVLCIDHAMLPVSSENLVRENKESWGASLTFLFVLMHNKIWPPLSEIPCVDSISVALSPTLLNGIRYEIKCLTRAHFFCFSFHIHYKEFLIRGLKL